VAIELLAAAQGIEFLRPLQSAPVLEAVLAQLRAVSPAMPVDRSLAREIAALHDLLAAGELGRTAAATLSELQALRLA
jgi:histidine ammonia-lyase